MTRLHWFGTGVLVLGAALASSSVGCSSSSSSGPADGGTGDEFSIHRLDSSLEESGADGGTAEYDGPALIPCTQPSFNGITQPPLPDGGLPEAGYAGTTGQMCQSNADCNGNFCNLNDPSPICEVPVDPTTGGNCDPGTDGAFHYCDGPDTSSSPGLCVPVQPGVGLCVQACFYAPGGAAAQGCTGNNACNPLTYGMTTGGSVVGIGFCGGGCTADSDCQGPYSHCIPEMGLCSTTAAGFLNGPCNCVTNSLGSGFCAQACVVTPTSHCPAGTVCDSFEPTSLPGSTGGTVAGFSSQNFGLSGACVPQCQNGACPSNATCSNGTAAGTDCQP